MKKIVIIACATLCAVGAADAKSLVAYYSLSGNTAAAAEIIKDATGADVFEIKIADENHYPSEYNEMTKVAQDEINNNTPVTINAVPDLAEYDTVFIGTPTWWGTMAVPVRTFLTDNDLSGKTVAVFNTHEGSGKGNVHDDIATLTPNATHPDGIAIRGSSVANATDEIKTWAENIAK